MDGPGEQPPHGVDVHRTDHAAGLSQVHVVREGFMEKVEHGVGLKQRFSTLALF